MNYVVNFGSIFSCLISCVVFPECYSAGWEGGPEEPTQTTGNPKLQPAGSDSGCAEADGLFTGEQYNATDAECQTTGNPVTPLTVWCVFMGIFHTSRSAFVKSENDTCWNRMGPSQNCYLKVRSMKLSKKSLYAETLRVSFTETKGLGPVPKEQPLHHNPASPKLYTCLSAVRQVPFFWQPPNSSIGLPDWESWFITPENTPPLLYSPMVECFAPLHPTIFSVWWSKAWMQLLCH